jgi:rfaE bifunctional protein nucleotidyltransferase chain/domain
MSDSVGMILERTQAAEQCESWRDEGSRLVFTNGVFDILHLGHVEYLAEAAALGERLIVGVNEDDSARSLEKGAGRPLNPAADRMAVLAALGCVDLVVPFEEETPLALVGLLRPDILVKGGDYTLDQIVGADEVRKAGGSVQTIPLREGYSSTTLIKRLRQVSEEGHGD